MVYILCFIFNFSIFVPFYIGLVKKICKIVLYTYTYTYTYTLYASLTHTHTFTQLHTHRLQAEFIKMALPTFRVQP